MNRRPVAAAALLAVLASTAACGDDAPATGGTPSGSLSVMSAWDGCDVFADLAAIQEYLGVTAVDGALQSDGLGEGIDAEAAGCSGLFDLASFEDTQGTFEYQATGDAAIRAGLAPWSTDAEAEANFADRVDVRRQNLPGVDYLDQVEGELGGEWDESLTVTAETEHRTYVDVYGRYGSWVVYVSVDYLHDPGVGAYESAPEFYPDSSAEEMAVYPFTTAQFTDWLAQEHLPQIQSDILERAGSE
ncbi:hypothetical protein K3N28_19165 [Glycomyces sp. TRM65418]|uniref:hypothetical protein n=1 Tax=Glycomyces sp. TRM65418 TaxID=2867006 RepID=UPI001CE6F1D1|nr:hypothetical protein [Glycomyces sp. TRM65418]MCC3765182.1 hypothetical protein [Glycomyces sp. TRM65418]QZD54807.1 hypothetical protein K3N28_19070 [Glycomyces sp. TRM65418]